MKAPESPANETERLEKLQSLDILDTSPESMFDDITRLAAVICGTPYSVVSMIDRDRQWFKSVEGPLGVCETSRDISFCGHAILGQQPFIIEDATKDPLFQDNPLVLEHPKIRFYAGAPLTSRDGCALGTLCVFGPNPGKLSDSQKEALNLLARQVTEKIEQRLNDALIENIGAMLDLSDSYVILVDPTNNRATYLNPALVERLPEPTTRNARRLLARLFPDLDYDWLLEQQHLQTEGPQPITSRLSLADDANGRADIRILPHLLNGRNTIVVLFRDNTELFQTRSSAREAQSNLRLFNQVAVQSKNGVVICDAEGRIEWVNKSFETTTGYTLAECTGKKPGALLQGPDTSKEHSDRMAQHIRKALPVSQDILNYTKQGQPYWVEVIIEPIRNEHGVLTNFVSTQTNVTQRKEQESAMEAARLAAERANNAKSQFLANISHELRTPLNGIIGITESLHDQATSDLRPMVETLNQSATHLFTLLNDILDLSQLENGHLTLTSGAFSPGALIKEVEALFHERAASVSTRLESLIDPRLPAALISDKTRLKQVLVNLTNNAIKFTHHGEITLSAELVDGALESDGSNLATVRFMVSDTGPGISESDQERIFENFEQLDNSSTRVHGGSGLGLAISRQIVRALGGDLVLESKSGEGASFSFKLGLEIPDSGVREESLTERRLTGALNELHVLLVDDNDVNRKVLADLLERSGLGAVYSAPSARRALVLLDNIQPDLIFLDIHMPEMDGLELLGHIKQEFAARGRKLPIIIACTADVSEVQKQRCLNAGFDFHLGKPITKSRINALFASLLDETVPVDKVNDCSDTTVFLGGSLLNLEHLMTSFDDDLSLTKDFLVAMRQSLPEQINNIERSLQNGQALDSNAAHQLKGLLSYFGHEEMLFQAQALQHSMAQNDQKVSQRLYKGLSPELSQLLQEIEKEVSKTS